MDEQEEKQRGSSNFLTYAIWAGVILIGFFILKNLFSTGPTNQDINKMVPTDMKVRMQPIVKSTSTDKVAVISVYGIIGMPGLTEKLTAELRSASQDPEVKAVILRVDSPGGGVHDTDLIHREILKYKSSKKPLIAFFNGVAASAAYYISAPADKIMATPATVTGSIGVIAQFPNYSGLMDKLGVKMHTIKSGAQKDMMSPYRPLDPEGEKILQAWIDESYDEFVHVVASGRKMDEKTIRQLADGRIYSARQAKKNHLIDSLGYFEDAVDLAKKLGNCPNAAVMDMNAFDARFGTIFERMRNDFLKASNPIDRIILPSGIYYIAPEFSQKYLDR